MKRMRTDFTTMKGRKRRITVILSLVLAAVLVVAGGLTAWAATAPKGRGAFTPTIAGYTDGRSSAVYTAPLGTTINFRGNAIFSVSSASALKGVKAFKVISNDMGENSNLKLTLTKSATDQGWSQSLSPNGSTFTYKDPNGSAIQPGTFNELMSKITVSFNTNSHAVSAMGTVSIRAYDYSRCDDTEDLIALESKKVVYVSAEQVVTYYGTTYYFDDAGNYYKCTKVNDQTWSYEEKTYVTDWTCKIVEYDFATGSVVTGTDTPKYNYKNVYATQYNQSYEDMVANAATQDGRPKISLKPDNSNQGRYDFELKLDDFSVISDGGQQYSQYASVGFQIREEGQSWDSSVPKMWLKATDNSGGLTMQTVTVDGQTIPYYEVAQYSKQVATGETIKTWDRTTRTYIYTPVYTTVIQGSPVYLIDLTDEDAAEALRFSISLPTSLKKAKENDPSFAYIDQLTYGKTYYVRGLVATDGKTSSPVYTEEVSFRYDPPGISNFKIGSTAVKYGNKNLTMDLSMLATFNDVNAVGRSYGANGTAGSTYSEPTLQARLYFTENKVTLPAETEDGTGYDNSEWIEFTGNQQALNAVTHEWERTDEPITQTKKMEVDNKGVRETNMAYPWDQFKLPETLAEVDPTGHASSTEKINSAHCALKLVVTDLYTGYSVASISDEFSIDAEDPTSPVVYAKKDFNGKRTGELTDGWNTAHTVYTEANDQTLSIRRHYTVGGEDGSVVVFVDGSTDIASDIREYQYSSYFLPSVAVNTDPQYQGKSAQQILQMLAGQRFTTNVGAASELYYVIDEDGNMCDSAGNKILRKDGKYYEANGTTEIDASKLVMPVTVDQYTDASGIPVTVNGGKYYSANGGEVSSANVSKWVDGNGNRILYSSSTYRDAAGNEITDPRMVKTATGDLSQIRYSSWTATSAAVDNDGNVLLDGSVMNNGQGSEIGQIAVAQDGFYCLVVKAVDGAERESEPVKAFFRVDLTPPNAPTIKLVKIATKANTSDPDTYEYYSNSTYTNSDVVLFAYSEPKTGKTLADFEYTTDGGLTWTKMLGWESGSTDGTWVKSSVKPGSETVYVEDYLVQGLLDTLKAQPGGSGVVTSKTTSSATMPAAYQPLLTAKWVYGGNAEKTTGLADGDSDMKYQIGIKISQMGYNDYTGFQIRAKDTMGNVSKVSSLEDGIMRTTPGNVQAKASMTHDSIEVALAIGNTQVNVDDITPDLKNRAAQKINNKYYWAKTYTDAGLGASATEAQIITALSGTPLTGTAGTAFTDAQINTAITNAKNAGKFINFGGFGPEVSQAQIKKMMEAGVFNPFVYIMTYGMRGAGNAKLDSSGKTTTTQSAYNIPHKCGWGADASCTGTCYHSNITQCPYDTLEDLGFYPYKPEYVNVSGMSSGSGEAGMAFYHFDHYDKSSLLANGTEYMGNKSATNSSITIGSTTVNTYTSTTGAVPVIPKSNPEKYHTSGTYKFYTAANHWVINATTNSSRTDDGIGAVGAYASGNIKARPLHVVAFKDNKDDGSNVYSNSLSDTFPLTQFRTYGYYTNCEKDWVLAYNDTPAKKQISFSIDDSRVYTHSNDGYGFMFNFTQRQKATTNGTGKWVMSGYIFYIYNDKNPGGTGQPYSWILAKLTDVDMAYFLGTYSNSTNLGKHWLLNNTPTGVQKLWFYHNGDSYGASSLVTSIRHFRLVCSGNTTKIYMWDDRSRVGGTKDQLEKKFNDDTNYGKNAGKSTWTEGYRAINWSSMGTSYQTILIPNGDNTELYTPRPSVDGDVIGSVGYANPLGGTAIPAAQYHKDTNCFGFGLIVGCNSVSHSCSQDSQITFSNLGLQITQTKKLSEVVTEPSWGNGKAKFIANLSDDAVSDFSDPVLNSAIQWRLNNDQAKYIGWGFTSNKAASEAFLANMAKASGDQSTTQALDEVGMYEQSNYPNTSNVTANYTVNIDDISTYITNRYFAAFGFDPYASGAIEDQLSPEGGPAKGTVYDANDIDNIVFNVEPEQYKKTSANPDFPAGRWYMVHDVVGYANSSGDLVTNGSPAAELDPRSGNWSDALETNVSLPGRYTYFFAPEKGADGKPIASGLTTENSKFSFVVNTAPVAQFTAGMRDSATQTYNAGTTDNPELKAQREIYLEDTSYDNDAKAGSSAAGSRKYQVKVSDVTGLPSGTFVNGQSTDTVLNGIVKWEWRYEVLCPASTYYKTSGSSTVNTTAIPNSGGYVPTLKIDKTGSQLLTVISSDWTATTNAGNPLAASPNGKVLSELISGLSATEQAKANWYLNNPQVLNTATYAWTAQPAITSFNELPESAIINVYLRVTDTSTYKDTTGKYVAAPNAGKVSAVCQVNVAAASSTATVQASNPAASSMTLSKLSMYDTAKYSSNEDNKVIRVTRTSSHSQKKDFSLIWKIGRGGDKNYRELERRVSGSGESATYLDNNFYWKVTSADVTAGIFHKWVWDDDSTRLTGSFSSTAAAAGDLIPVLIQSSDVDKREKFGSSWIRVSDEDSGKKVKSSTGGEWTINYQFLEEYLKDYRDASTGLTLQINEILYGYTTEEVVMNGNNAKQSTIVDSSARTIFLKTDKTAPSAQVVTTEEVVRDLSTGAIIESETGSYNASQYLDVTDGTHYLRVKVSGSADLEGKAAGYGYYFYRKNALGAENAWYKLVVDNSSGIPVYRTQSVDPESAKYTVKTSGADRTNNQVSASDYSKYYLTKGSSADSSSFSGETIYNVTAQSASDGTQVSMIEYRMRVQLYNEVETEYRTSKETQYKSEHENASASTILAAVTKYIQNKYLEKLTARLGDTTKRNAMKTLVGEYLAVSQSDQKVFTGNTNTEDQVFTILFGREAMVDTPTDKLNLAIFAYDKQITRDDTATGANEATRTRIEDIKMSVSNPLPPAITVKDAATRQVVAISNIGGYLFGNNDNAANRIALKRRLSGLPSTMSDSEVSSYTGAGTADYDAFVAVRGAVGSGGTDHQVNDATYGRFANSAVTVFFEPKQSYYSVSTDADGVTTYTRGSGQQYYEDIYGAADLTGKAEILYNGYYWRPGEAPSDPLTAYKTDSKVVTASADLTAEGFTDAQITDLATTAKNLDGRIITSAESLSFSVSGTYVIEAWVVNGSGTKSKEPRIVVFDIDTQAPENMLVEAWKNDGNGDQLYTSGEWAMFVELRAKNATDLNPDRYEYSIDNGRSWYTLGLMGLQERKLDIPSTGSTAPGGHAKIESGQYDVLIRAVDLAGNANEPEAFKVKVDNQPPETGAPTLTASSVSTKLYNEYVVNVTSIGSGTVTAYVNDVKKTENMANPIVDVPSKGKLSVLFVPEEGYKVGKITVNGEDLANLPADNTYTVNSVTKDYSIEVTFIQDTVAGLASLQTYNSIRTGVGALQMTADAFSQPQLTQPDGVASLMGDGDEGDGSNGEGGAPDSGEGEGEPGGSRGEGDGEPGGDDPPATVEYVTVVSAKTGTGSGDVKVIGLDDENKVIKNSNVTVYAKPDRFNTLDSITVTMNGVDTVYAIDDDTNPLTLVTAEGSYKDYYYCTFAAVVGPNISVNFSEMETRTVILDQPDSVEGSLSLTPDADHIDNNGTSYTVVAGTTVTVNIANGGGYMPVELLINDQTMQIEDEGTHEMVPVKDLEAGINASYPVVIPARSGEDQDEIHIRVVYGVTKRDPNTYPLEVKVRVQGYGTVTPGLQSASDQYTQKILELPSQYNRTFTFVPAEHYELSYLHVQSFKLDRYGVPTEEVVDSDKLQGASSIPGVSGGKSINYAPLSNSIIDAKFTLKKHKITLSSSSMGGTVTISRASDGHVFTAQEMAEGIDELTPITIDIKTKTGYKVKTVDISQNGVHMDVGKVSQITLQSVTGPLMVKVDFDDRTVSKIDSAHSITAVAEGVNDSDSELADKGYRFVIRKGSKRQSDVSNGWATAVNETGMATWPDWTDWQSQNTITFTQVYDGTKYVDLKPNEAYTVYVQTVDKVGNLSTAKGATVFTLANVAGTVSVANKNDEGNSATKSVLVEINENDNPSHTEYRVYYSTDDSMNDATIAKAGWSTLKQKDDWKYVVDGLLPGNHYYLQAESINHDGKVTPKDDDDKVDIMLSPAAPDLGSFYYELQTDPTAPVILHWDAPDGDVKYVQLYRGDKYLGQFETDVLSYEDEEGYKYFADSIVKYSYCFVNSAGPGSSQTAVNEAYYDALKLAKNATDDHPEDKVLAEKIQNAESGHNQVFSEVMTYPTYPLELYAENIVAGSVNKSGSHNTGTLTVTMNVDTSMMRYQEYDLYLKAYKASGLDAEGNKVFETTPSPLAEWDNLSAYRDANGVDGQKVVTTRITRKADGTYAPTATWTNLNDQYGYKVFVQEVRSTGKGNGDGTAGGQANGVGVEGYLGMKFYVNETTYGYTYSLPSSMDADVKATMPDNTGNAWADLPPDETTQIHPLTRYTNGKNWSDPLYSEVTGFNETPYIKLADEWWAGNDESKIKEDASGKYLLINSDAGSSDTTGLDFTVKVLVWDNDAKDNSNAYVRATMEGLEGEAILDATQQLGSSEANAKAYTITFNARSLPTGVFGKLEQVLDDQGQPVLDDNGQPIMQSSLLLKVSDGVTEGTSNSQGIRLVINQNKPTGKVVNGVKQYLENGAAITTNSFAEVEVSLTKDAAEADEALGEVALIIMQGEYGRYTEDGWKVTNFDALTSYLVNATLPAGYSASDLQADLAHAVSKLTAAEKSNSAYMSQTANATTGLKHLTAKGLNTALLRVSPPVTKYVCLGAGYSGQQAYLAASDKLTALHLAPEDYLWSERGSDGTTYYYWMEMKKALETESVSWLRYGKYTKITQAEYNANSTNAFVVGSGSKATYWRRTDASTTYVTPIIDLADDSSYEANDKVNTRMVKARTEFGGNTKEMPLDYVIRDVPRSKISSEKVFAWRQVSEQEFRFYACRTKDNGEMSVDNTGFNINDRITRSVNNKECTETTVFTGFVVDWNGGSPIFTSDGQNLTDLAYRILNKNGTAEVSFADYNTLYSDETDESEKDFIFQVYKLEDNKGTVTSTSVTVQIDTFLGIYNDGFKNMGMLISLDKDYVPQENGANVDETMIKTIGKVTANGAYVVSATGLTPNTPYYLWSFYQLDGEAENIRHFSEKHYVCLTTEDSFPTAYYGFTVLQSEYREENMETNTDTIRSYTITAIKEEDNSGETAWGDVEITPTYYLADEFGNMLNGYQQVRDEEGQLVTDQNGNPVYDWYPVEITNDASTVTVKTGEKDSDGNDITKEVVFEANTLQYARNAISLSGITEQATQSVVIQFGKTQLSDTFNVRFRNNSALQHHLIMRLKLSIKKHSSGFCQLFRGQETLDIFLRDDEDYITTFRLGVSGEGTYLGDENDLKEMKALNGSDEEEPTEFEYQFNGVQVGYIKTGVLTVSYWNAGDGDLQNITAWISSDAAGENVLSDPGSMPFIVEDMDTEDLLKSVDSVGTMQVHPAKGLEDGVHEAYLNIKADKMEPSDVIHIHLRQVVGQSTLSGRVYLVSGMENIAGRVGVSTVEIYDYNSIHGQTKDAPDYVTKTDENGYYEIPNILNNARYHIVVKRDGFVTYDSSLYARAGINPIDLVRNTGSHTFTLNLCLRGGDIDGNGVIEQADLDILVSHYAKQLAHYKDDPETLAVLKRCDFNEDGVINALDRNYLFSNLNFENDDYAYATLSPTD